MRRRRRFTDFDTEHLTLDPTHKKLGGVCAGIAHYYGWSRFWVRVAALVALFVAPHAALIAYGLAYLILDKRDRDNDLEAEFADLEDDL